MNRYMNRYERAEAAVKRFFDTHTAAEVVAYVKKIAPYAFEETPTIKWRQEKVARPERKAANGRARRRVAAKR